MSWRSRLPTKILTSSFSVTPISRVTRLAPRSTSRPMARRPLKLRSVAMQVPDCGRRRSATPTMFRLAWLNLFSSVNLYGSCRRRRSFRDHRRAARARCPRRVRRAHPRDDASYLPQDEPRSYLYELLADYPRRGGKMLRSSLCIAMARATGADVEDAISLGGLDRVAAQCDACPRRHRGRERRAARDADAALAARRAAGDQRG